ncbi:hypothetical protein BSLG_006554 [Batrachochytrium salamandrivorans]|nr:hypothetical protein BSLG_006554 [Batrachochytrium salamandrivorans]
MQRQSRLPSVAAQQHLPYDCILDDTWSVGVLILNILAAKNPWEVACSGDANFRQSCGLLHPDPNQRCQLSEARMAIARMTAFIRPTDVAQSFPVTSKSSSTYAKTSPVHPAGIIDVENESEYSADELAALDALDALDASLSNEMPTSSCSIPPAAPQPPAPAYVVCQSTRAAATQRCHRPLTSPHGIAESPSQLQLLLSKAPWLIRIAAKSIQPSMLGSAR